MANPIPPLVSNTPPPIDFDENNENDDDFEGFETSDVIFNNNFLDDLYEFPTQGANIFVHQVGNSYKPSLSIHDRSVQKLETNHLVLKLQKRKMTNDEQFDWLKKITERTNEGTTTTIKQASKQEIPSLPSTPRNLSKTPDSFSGLDLPVISNEDITDPIISKKSINQIEINSTDLDNSKIILEKQENKCEAPSQSNINCIDGYIYCESEIVKKCEKFETKINDDHVIAERPDLVNFYKHGRGHDSDFDDFKLIADSPSLLFSNNDYDDDIKNLCETNNNNSSSNMNQINKNNNLHITNFDDDDGSVLSLKLDSMLLSTYNSPILNETNLKQNCNVKHDVDVETDIQIFHDNDEKLDDDNGCFQLNKLQEFQEHVNSSEIILSNELETSFETHFEANFNNAEFTVSVNAINEKSIPIQMVDAKSHLNDIDEDDFDDFQDFTVSQSKNGTENNNLKALTKNKNTDDEIYDKNSDLNAIAINIDDDDDDDFGDFTQSQTIFKTVVFQNPVLELEQFISDLDRVFPLQENFDDLVKIDIKNHEKIEKCTSLMNLLDFDSTIALLYQWNNSNSNQVLVKSLGIDSRNILFGSKWNISVPRFAANLGFCPLEPLKPTITPTMINSNNNKEFSSTTQTVIGTDVPAAQFDWNSAGLVNPLDDQTETVQEMGFSENQPTRTEINSITNYSLCASTILSPTTKFPPVLAPVTPSKETSSIKTGLESQLLQNNDFGSINNSFVSSSPGNLRETHIFTPSKGGNSISRDVSCINTITLESTNIEEDSEEFQLPSEIKINKNVITKEYRDVEYEFPGSNDILQPIKLINNTNSNSNTNIIINWPDPGDFSSSKSLESGIISKRNSDEFEFTEFQGTNTIKYDPRDDDVEYDAELKQHNYENLDNNNTKCAILSSPMHRTDVINIDEFLKPRIGLSPTEELKKNNTKNNFDEEFTEFQYVSPPPQSKTAFNTAKQTALISPDFLITQKMNNTVLSNYNNSYELPSINTVALTSLHDPTSGVNQNNRKPVNSVWADPSGIDSDEIARIEAAFSYNKSNMSQQMAAVPEDAKKTVTRNNTKDDEEWTDFVSITIDVTNKTEDSINKRSFISSNNRAKTIVDDDWSEFVSGLPAVPILSSNYKSISNHKGNSRPNFSSWNSPIQYNSLKESMSSPSMSQLLQAPSDIQNLYKTHNDGLILNPTINLNNQISNGISLIDIGKPNSQGKNNININNNISKINSSTYNNTKPQQRPNISLIPDLGFVAPKNVINVPRTNFNTKK